MVEARRAIAEVRRGQPARAVVQSVQAGPIECMRAQPLMQGMAADRAGVRTRGEAAMVLQSTTRPAQSSGVAGVLQAVGVVGERRPRRGVADCPGVIDAVVARVPA